MINADAAIYASPQNMNNKNLFFLSLFLILCSGCGPKAERYLNKIAAKGDIIWHIESDEAVMYQQFVDNTESVFKYTFKGKKLDTLIYFISDEHHFKDKYPKRYYLHNQSNTFSELDFQSMTSTVLMNGVMSFATARDNNGEIIALAAKSLDAFISWNCEKGLIERKVLTEDPWIANMGQRCMTIQDSLGTYNILYVDSTNMYMPYKYELGSSEVKMIAYDDDYMVFKGDEGLGIVDYDFSVKCTLPIQIKKITLLTRNPELTYTIRSGEIDEGSNLHIVKVVLSPAPSFTHYWVISEEELKEKGECIVVEFPNNDNTEILMWKMDNQAQIIEEAPSANKYVREQMSKEGLRWFRKGELNSAVLGYNLEGQYVLVTQDPFYFEHIINILDLSSQFNIIINDNNYPVNGISDLSCLKSEIIGVVTVNNADMLVKFYVTDPKRHCEVLAVGESIYKMEDHKYSIYQDGNTKIYKTSGYSTVKSYANSGLDFWNWLF